MGLENVRYMRSANKKSLAVCVRVTCFNYRFSLTSILKFFSQGITNIFGIFVALCLLSVMNNPSVESLTCK